MEAGEIKKHHWYMIESYGDTHGIKGQAVDVCGKYVTMRFYWGAPFRTRQAVKINSLIGECEKPALFSNN